MWGSMNALLVISAVFLFVIKFKKLPPSENPDDWATFSTYFNNMLNPILMSFYIYFLIKLTFVAADYNKKNVGDQLRQNAFIEISKRLYSLATTIKDSSNIKRDLDFLKIDIISFSATMNHLFEIKNLELVTDELCNSLSAISECPFIQHEMRESQFDYQEFIALFEKFDNQRITLIDMLQKKILKDDK
jgi:hypothetical protein